MSAGIPVTEAEALPLVDHLFGISGQSAGRVSYLALASILAGSGSIANDLASIRSQVTRGLLAPSTWTELEALTGSEDAAGAEVPLSDDGTHAQATATGYDGDTVNNHGRYKWSEAWSRWVRIGEFGGAVSDVVVSLSGTANALSGSSDRDHSKAPYAAKFVAQVVDANTGPVTMGIDGGTARSLVTNTGAELQAGELLPGMVIEWRWNGEEYRLIPGITVAAMVQRSEDARDAAEISASAALLSEGNASNSAGEAALSEANAAASEGAAAASEANAYTHRSQAELAALASGRAIVTALSSDPVPADGAIELLQTGPGMQVCQVVAGAWVTVGWLGEVLYDNPVAVFSSTDTNFNVGQIIRSREGNHGYKVAPAPAIADWVTPGGTRLHVEQGADGHFHARAFAKVSGDSFDDMLDVIAAKALADPTEPYTIYTDNLKLTLDDATRHSLPVNLRLLGRSTGRVPQSVITVNHVDGGFTWARPATLPGGIDQSTWWASTIAGFDNIHIQGFGTKQVVNLVEIQSIINFRCTLTKFTNAVTGMRAVNTLGRWCEFQLYENCSWEENTINFDMDVDGGTNSMGHSRFINCYMGLDDGSSGIRCRNGVSPYNGFWQFNTFTRNGAAFFDLDNGSIKKGVFALTFENRSTGGTFMRAANNSEFRGNKGSVSSFSSSIGYIEDDDTTVYAQTSNAALIFSGMIWDRGDGVALASAEDVPTYIAGHPNKRVPVNARQITLKADGPLVAGARLDVIPRAPGEEHEWRVYRVDIWVTTPGSGNADGVWKLDISKSVGSMNTMLGRTDLVIADGTVNNQVNYTDFKLGAANWYGTMSGLWSLAAEAGVANDNIAPQEVFLTMTMC